MRKKHYKSLAFTVSALGILLSSPSFADGVTPTDAAVTAASPVASQTISDAAATAVEAQTDVKAELASEVAQAAPSPEPVAETVEPPAPVVVAVEPEPAPAPVEVVKAEEPAPAPEPVEEAKPQGSAPDKSIITEAVLKNIKEFLFRDIVVLSVQNQNIKYESIAQADIDTLDKTWREETKSDDQPLISSTLSNPLSSYLTRIQALSLGLYTEIFVMDDNGLNVGQSNISSDYWQGDEDKFQKTFSKGATTIFIDEVEFRDDVGAWVAQVNLSIADPDKKAIGAATVEVNLTELQRRSALQN